MKREVVLLVEDMDERFVPLRAIIGEPTEPEFRGCGAERGEYEDDVRAGASVQYLPSAQRAA